jgi:hypothetical protein
MTPEVSATGSSPGPGELGYAEVVTGQSASSTTYVDVPGWTYTATSRGRPMIVEAWTSASPQNDTLGSGGKYKLVRTDTGNTISDHEFISSAANAPESLSPLIGRIPALPVGTQITFKVQVGTRVGGVATFGAASTQPLAIQVRDVDA